MENCTIYSHKLDFARVAQIVQSKWPKAIIELQEDGLNKVYSAVLKGGIFSSSKSLIIKYRERENPSYKLTSGDDGLSRNLAGMTNFIRSFPARNESLQDKFTYKVGSINSEMSLTCEPEITPEFQDMIRSITDALDGFIFAQPNRFFNRLKGPSFLDKDFRIIIDASGNSEVDDINVNVDAKYMDKEDDEATEDQIDRKKQSEETLREAGVKINEHLPYVSSFEETWSRTPEEIIERAYALLIVAAKGEGIEQEHLDRVISKKNITGFSPREAAIVQTESLSEKDRAYATWRYESLNVMLWALGKIDKLNYPNDICNVGEIVNLINTPSREEFENSITIRTEEELLDWLDLAYRMHWACVDARVKGEPISGGLESGVVYERHYSLRWLTSQDEEDWDDVTTAT